MAKRLHDLFDLGPSVDYWEDPRFCSLLGEDAAMMGASGAGAYSIPYAVLLNGTDEYLSWTPSGAGNRRQVDFYFEIMPGNTGTTPVVYAAGTDNNNRTLVYIDANDKINFFTNIAGVTKHDISWPGFVRDLSGAPLFCHLSIDADQATGALGAVLTINGVEQTATVATWVTTTDMWWNSTNAHYIGRNVTSSNYYYGRFGRLISIDGGGTAATDFCEFDLVTDNWKAKNYTGAYSGNAFFLDWSNGAALGTDASGNGNDWTATNIDSTNQVTNTPTNVAARWSPIGASDPGLTATRTFSEGNRRVQIANTGAHVAISTFKAPNDMELWWETECVSLSGTVETGVYFGEQWDAGSWLTSAVTYKSDGNKRDAGSTSAYGATYTATDVIGWHYDGAGTLTAYKQTGGTGSFVSQGAIKTGITGPIYFYVVDSGTGPTIDFRLNVTEDEWNNTSPPSGALALCTDNLPAVTDSIDNHMETLLYTGNGTTQDVTGTDWGQSSQLIWDKSRSVADNHFVIDSLRGNTARLATNTTSAETTEPNELTAFLNNGFSLGNAGGMNSSGRTYAAWRFNLPSSETNTSGTISVDWIYNATLGMAVGIYTGNGVAGATLGITAEMGALGAPKAAIAKARTGAARDWPVYHEANGATKTMWLNSTAASTTASTWNNTAPTSSVFTLGSTVDINASTVQYVIILFFETPFCRIGSYTGNGNADGPCINEMASPVWELIKLTSSAGGAWTTQDNATSPYNPATNYLQPNSSAAEATGMLNDFLAVGAKRRVSGFQNTSGETYIYVQIGQPMGKHPGGVNTAR